MVEADGRARLVVSVGFATERGPRRRNEDYCGVWLGSPEQQARLGVVAALADGVGGAKGGRVAAETAVRGFIDGYVSRPDTLGVRPSVARSLEAVNRWIHAVGTRDPYLEGMASTFTALILRGREAHLAHVGDSRLYRLRDDRLTRLTIDHTLAGVGRNHVLARAVGSADAVKIDYAVEELVQHDRYLLCSDGVHGALSDRQIAELLARRAAPEESARQLVDAALAARSTDNATALVIDVPELPERNLSDLQLEADLPILAPPRSGASIDDFVLGPILADGRYCRVFRASDRRSGQQAIVKFPKPLLGEDAALRQAFLREAWIPSRVRSPYVGESIDLPPERRSRLYTVLPFYAGETLERRLSRPPAIRLTPGLAIATRLARGVAALHRAGVIHRDIKPENVILEEDGGLKLIDLGAARLPHLDDAPLLAAPGTPSYMAPEMLAGAEGDEKTDQFALGVTIFRMFAGRYPYGEVEPFSRPRFTRSTPLTAIRADLPAWLSHVLARATAVRPEDRYGDVLEFIFALENGADRAGPRAIGPAPLYHRNPVIVWQTIAALLAIALALALWRVGIARLRGE